jgi:hypothetical protein
VLAPKSPDHEGLLWELNDTIEDVRHFKRDQWQFAYAAIGAEAGVLILTLSNPDELLLFHRILVTGAALGIWLFWFFAHSSSVQSLDQARAQIRSFRKALGGGFQGGPFATAEGSRQRRRRLMAVSTAMFFAVTGAAFLALFTGWAAGSQWAGFEPRAPSNVQAAKSN